MSNFLHTFNPTPIMISLGPINLYWYGFFMVVGVLAAISISIILAKFYQVKTETMIDLAVWLIVGGLIGARLYHVFLELPYYLANPLLIFKIWQGGLAIHGAIGGGLIALWLFTKKYRQNFWQLAAITASTLPLAQAIGRWGNYFNQELFGRPTSLPWGIPINPDSRPWQYLSYDYFQPAFLYESIGNLVIFFILIFFQVQIIKKQKFSTLYYLLCLMGYAIMYSLLRFSLEFIRIDATPIIFGLRFPQAISLFIIILTALYFASIFWRKVSKNKTIDK